MHIAIALAIPDRLAKSWEKRLSKKEFLKLNSSDQKSYLKKWPQSSHRYLLAGDKGGKKKDAGGPSKKEKAMVEATRDTRPDRNDPSLGDMRIGPHDDNNRFFEDEKRKKRNQLVKQDIKSLNQSNAGAITPASLEAIDNLKDTDLVAASDGMIKNKQAIVVAVKNQAQKQPAMFDRGLTAVSDVVHGKPAGELTISERFAMERTITSVATIALFGAGILAASLCAAPLGVLAGRVLFEMWAKNGGRENLQSDLSELRKARQRKARKERKAREAEIAQKIHGGSVEEALERAKEHEAEMEAEANGRKFDREEYRKKAKARLGKHFDKNDDDMDADFDDMEKMLGKLRGTAAAQSHSDTVNLIVEQLSDILKYHKARDFKDNRDEMFATASACDPHFSAKYLLELAGCRNFEASGAGLLFDCAGGRDAIMQLFGNLKLDHEFEKSGEGQIVDYFSNGDCRASVGPCGERFYIRYDGDIYNVRNG